MNKTKLIIIVLLISGLLFYTLASLFKTDEPVTDMLLSLIVVTLFYKVFFKDKKD